MDDFSALSPTRKADRAKAANALRAIARRFGFSTSAQVTGHDVLVRLEHPCGACASLWIDRTSANAEVVAWHTAANSGWTYPDSFGNSYGDVNPYHHQKSTKVYPWAALPAMLQSDCRKIARLAG